MELVLVKVLDMNSITNKKNLIIGCINYYSWDTIKFWINSIKYNNINADICLVVMNCDSLTVKQLVDNNVIVVPTGGQKDNLQCTDINNSSADTYSNRFFYISKYIDIEKYEYVITTDVRDVIFQSDPFVWLKDNLKTKEIVFVSENVRIKDEPWHQNVIEKTFGKHILKQMMEYEAYNVGVIAGKAKIVKNICLEIYAYSVKNKFIPSDQSVFNFIIRSDYYKEKSYFSNTEDSWAIMLKAVQDHQDILINKVDKKLNGIVENNNDEQYCITHQWDRVDSLKDYIYMTYS